MTRSAAQAWRTVLTALVTVAMQLAGFIYATRHGIDAQVAAAFGSFCMFSTAVALGQATKSSVESLAQGSGLAGAKAALLTDAKPGEP